MRLLVFGDIHYRLDSEVEAAWAERLGAFERAYRPDVTVYIGDLLTFESINPHIKPGSGESKTQPTVEEELAGFSNFMRVLTRSGGKRRRIVTRGNHDQEWLQKFEEQFPAVSGTYSAKVDRILHKHRVESYDYGSLVEIEGFLFTHIPIINGRRVMGMYAEEKVLRSTTKPVVFGHTHRAKMISDMKYGNDAETYVVNVGCSLPYGHREAYMGHSLSHWNYVVTLMEIDAGKLNKIEFVSTAQI